MEKCLLEDILGGIGDIEDFAEAAADLSRFSRNKRLYDYQREAVHNCLKLLYLYYRDYRFEGENTGKSKERLMEVYEEARPGFSLENRLGKYTKDRRRSLNEKFVYFTRNRYFKQTFGDGGEYIEAKHFYNRCAFWMATASGKSVVIVKLIDLLKRLMDRNLIPEKPILLLRIPYR